MTHELTILTLAALLQVVQYGLMAVPANIELGTGKTASPRDPSRMSKPLDQQVSVKTSRLMRAMNNHFEGLILFTIAVLVVTMGEQSSWVTKLAATNYLIARILYIPAYAYGWTPWRSAIWGWGFLSTIIMLIAALI